MVSGRTKSLVSKSSIRKSAVAKIARKMFWGKYVSK
jgi:hypothetical protein